MPRLRAGLSVSGRAHHKCAVTAIVVGGIVAVMGKLEQKCKALVERISRYPMSEAARVRNLAEIEAIYRQERSRPASDDMGDDIVGK